MPIYVAFLISLRFAVITSWLFVVVFMPIFMTFRLSWPKKFFDAMRKEGIQSVDEYMLSIRAIQRFNVVYVIISLLFGVAILVAHEALMPIFNGVLVDVVTLVFISLLSLFLIPLLTSMALVPFLAKDKETSDFVIKVLF